MPNMNDILVLILIAILLIALAIFLTQYFLTSKFKLRLNQLKEREQDLRSQYNIYKDNAEKQLSAEKNFSENLNVEKNQLKQEVTSLEADVRNLKDRIEEIKLENSTLSNRLEDIVNERENLNIELTQVKSENNNLNTRLTEEKAQLEELNQKFHKEFENLANKILEEKSEKFATQNKESLAVLLNPLQEKIKGFEKRVEDTHKESIEHGARLRQQIIGLKELNEQMSKEANNLTRALKGESKTQGNWGEMVLKSVLEKSGLEKDLEYFEQQSFTTEDGKRVQPDVVIHLPENKRMIIDSKVSLTAYEEYVNQEDDNIKEEAVLRHLASIKSHIDTLSAKNYHTLYDIESPDFVLLFIPIESAFAVASQKNPKLYQSAFEKNIILVTPTTLLAVLKTIDSMWNNEKQKKNAIEIANRAGALYDSFVNLTDELIKVGKQIGTVQNSYESAMKKLTGKGNLIRRVEGLKKLGVKANKEINQNLLKRAELEGDD